MKKLDKFIRNYIEDALIFSGLAVLVGTTFFINVYAGFYAAGLVLLGMGLYFARFPPTKGVR